MALTEHMMPSGVVVTGGAQERDRGKVVPSICVFDVNETLLDIEFIAPLFQRLFGDSKVLREGFGQLILYSASITLSAPYTTFFGLDRACGRCRARSTMSRFGRPTLTS